MHIAFVDDSKQAGKRKGMGDLIALGAVVFAEEQLKPFADAFYESFDNLHIPHDVELKWSGSRDDWFRKNKKSQLKTPLRRAILEAARDAHARVVVAIWDKAAVRTLNGKLAEEGIVDLLFERVSMMLENDKQRGIIVFDKPGGDHKDEDKWIADTLPLTSTGTEYVKPNAVVIPILTAPSHHHPHLQLADLVTGSVTAAIAGSPYGVDLIPDVKPMFHVNWLGQVAQSGLKLYPDNLINLHHWVLGEHQAYRHGSLADLPNIGFSRFTSDDGL